MLTRYSWKDSALFYPYFYLYFMLVDTLDHQLCCCCPALSQRPAFLESALPQVRSLLRRPQTQDLHEDGDVAGTPGEDAGATRLLAFVGFVAPLVEDWARLRRVYNPSGENPHGSVGPKVASFPSGSHSKGCYARQAAALVSNRSCFALLLS